MVFKFKNHNINEKYFSPGCYELFDGFQQNVNSIQMLLTSFLFIKRPIARGKLSNDFI